MDDAASPSLADDEEVPASSWRRAMADEVMPECAICTDAPWQPTRIECGHVFCLRCLKEVVRRGAAEHEEPAAGCRCPLCRRPFAADAAAWQADERVAQVVRENHPEVYARRSEEAAARLRSTIVLKVGFRCGAIGGAVVGDDGAASVRWVFFVEVVPPPEWAAGKPDAGAAATAMLIDAIVLTTRSRSDDDDDDDEGDLLQMPPYEVHGIGSLDCEVTARVRVDWKRRLQLEPLFVTHRAICAVPASVGAETLHEVELGRDGLTVARVLERSRPKARVAVGLGGGGSERLVF